MTTFVAERYFAFHPAKSCLRLFVPARVFNLCPIAQGCKGSKSNIHADSRSAWRQWLWLTLNCETGVPAPGFSFDCEGLDLAFYLAVQFNLDATDFRQLQLCICERKAMLRIGETVVTGRCSVARKACFISMPNTSKESFESFKMLSRRRVE